LAGASAALDIQTGAGEVLAGAGPFPPTMVATEGWPPNAALATKLLHPLGVVLVATANQPSLPFADEAFDLVSSRHPRNELWTEIARVLRPGGTYFAQLRGATHMFELLEYFIGPQTWAAANAEAHRAQAEAAGLDVVDLRMELLRAEFFDIGAVVYFLRKVSAIPGFTVERYRRRLAELHERIEADGPFVTHTTRVLVEARKPAEQTS
jgi:SAM-dependent methyltransferase